MSARQLQTNVSRPHPHHSAVGLALHCHLSGPALCPSPLSCLSPHLHISPLSPVLCLRPTLHRCASLGHRLWWPSYCIHLSLPPLIYTTNTQDRLLPHLPGPKLCSENRTVGCDVRWLRAYRDKAGELALQPAWWESGMKQSSCDRGLRRPWESSSGHFAF